MRYASYARLSRKHRDDDDREARAASIQQQLTACRRYVEGHGHIVVLEQTDVQSGLDSDRRGYQSLLQAAREKRFDVAVVWRWDRWGRDHIESARSCREMSDLGVEIQSATEPSADDGGFTRDLLFLLANRESRNTSARVKPIQKMKASDGRWQGRPPAGYDLVAGKLQPNAQAPLIAQLFELAATGNYSITKLRRWSHLKGLTSSTGKEPSRSLLHKWLTNPVYAGDVVYNRRANGKFEPNHLRPESEWVRCGDAHPSIVDRNTFAAVQAVLAEHKTFQGTIRGSRWLLTSRIFCGHCGSRMYGRTAGRGNYTYACYAGHYYDTCQLRSTGGKAVDRWVKARISSIQIGNDVRRAAHRLVKDQAQRQMADFHHRRKELLAAQKRHQEDRKKLARGLNAEIIPPDVYRQLEEDEAAALKVIGQEMATLEMPRTADLGPVLEALSSLTWETLDNEAWREVVALLIQRVAVYGLNNYRLTWSDTGTALREALQTVS